MINKNFKVTVKWPCGQITKEIVTKKDSKYYYFKYELNKSYYAPKHFCTKLK